MRTALGPNPWALGAAACLAVGALWLPVPGLAKLVPISLVAAWAGWRLAVRVTRPVVDPPRAYLPPRPLGVDIGPRGHYHPDQRRRRARPARRRTRYVLAAGPAHAEMLRPRLFRGPEPARRPLAVDPAQPSFARTPLARVPVARAPLARVVGRPVAGTAPVPAWRKRA